MQTDHAALPPYPIIAGPTASGKTAVAVGLAKRIGGEVVSADSMQIYADVSVGTARPSLEEMAGVPHHLLGFLPLHESYSVARYVEDADAVFSEVLTRGHTPILCGGTGLYIQSFADHLIFTQEESDPDLRDRLQREADTLGGAAMLARLATVDPETAARLHENDLNRIIRALEVYYTTGHTIAEQVAASRQAPSPYRPYLFVLNFHDRDMLYDRINRRVEQMMANGLVDEAARVLAQDPRATVLQAIGYKELLPYLSGEVSLDEALEALKRGTRHYAKRQLSWFRRMVDSREDSRMIYMDDYADAADAVSDIERIFGEFCERR